MVLGLFLQILVEVVTDPINQYVVMPITRHVSYAFKSNSRVQTLHDDIVQLKNKRDRLQQSVVYATRNGEEIYPNVTEWLSNAERAIGEAEELVHMREEAKKKCFVGLCPNLKTRYKISKNAEKKATVIHKLRNEEGLDSISFRPPLQQISQPSVYRGESLPSRVSILSKIMDALRDLNLNMIGVYGMGGVGKTTLVKEVQSKAIQEKLFETVVVVPVSQNPDLNKIQGEIADFLGLKFDAEETSGRASQLHKRLENSRVLIILDDLWKKLDLVAVGIPAQKETSKGCCCKTMLTSRNMHLLSKDMEAEKLFPLEALEEAEALSLFMSVAKPNDNFHDIATKIAKKCAGLPLLVQIIAVGLKNEKSHHVWNDTLNQLARYDNEDIYEKVYKVIESSYNKLPGEEIKSLFLLCALFGQSNIQIQYLLTYSMGLGIFKHIQTIERARDRVFSLIDKLKANSLLLDGDMVGFVKIHDVVHDTARNIASREQHAFFGTSEFSLRDRPHKDCTRISLQIGGVNELPVMNCPEAELFLFFTEDLSLRIQDSFFAGMKKLKVVDLRGARLVSFPSSICLLEEIQALCLHECRLDDVAALGKLKRLELLSFAGSKIVELPKEIEALTQLKLLDLRDCSNLRVIPASVLPKLLSLEELYMLNSFVRWDKKGNASLMELDSLAHLSTLEIHIPDLELIPAGFMCFNQLKNYKISIGRVRDRYEQRERSKTLKLTVKAGIDLKDDMKSLLTETEFLYLNGVRGIERVFCEGFPELKHMQVEYDDDIQYLIKPTMWASCNAFPVLESLYLSDLYRLENICCGQLGMGSFGELQILKIRRCNKLSSLFSFSSVKCLQQLREMEVVSCESMEAVVGERSEDEHQNNEVIEFAQLSSLKLENLPHLIGFGKIEEGNEQMRVLFNTMVFSPNLTRIKVKKCSNLKHIFTASTVKCQMQLKNLEIEGCELVEEIIRSKKMEEIDEAIVFPKLYSLSLVSLHNLERFSSCCSIEFPLLRKLSIQICEAIGNFVVRDSSSESEEYLFNEMVTFSNLETLEIYGINSIKYLWDEHFIADDSFFKLKSITIGSCSKLSVVFPSKICTRFQRVETLSLHHCDRVKEIYQWTGFAEIKNAFSLRDLHLMYLRSLKHIWNKESEWGDFFTFQNLQSVRIWDCEDLKYVFPASVGCGLLQLRQLTLEDCNRLEVMISRDNDDETSDPSFQFPELTELQLWRLKEMRSLHTLQFPKLKSFKVVKCSQICVPMFIPNLEEMTIDEHASHTILQSTDFSDELCTKLKKVTLSYLDKETLIAIVLGVLSGIKSLEMLVLDGISISDGSLNQRSIGDEPHLNCLGVKHLKVKSIHKLKHIIKKDSQFNHIFQRLQTLQIVYCADLMSIGPSSTSLLQNLTTLHIDSCDEVTNLVTASTAKTMVHLIEMKVEDCRRIEEIVAGDAEHDDQIIFKKLQYLELKRLPELNSFCSNKYNFSFPRLEKITIERCSRMHIFCGGNTSTPKLRGILFEDEQHWEGDLNATIASQIRIWVGGHLEDGRLFQNVESLNMVVNTLSSKAILLPSQMQFLNKLRRIRATDIDSIQVVFDLEGLPAVEGYSGLLPKLIRLELISLPMLTQLCNKAPQGILDFNKLKVLKIHNCSRLEYALTWSMASCLSQLKRVQVRRCEMMETIIIEGKKMDEIEEDSTETFVFPKLESLTLDNLPNLKRFSSCCSIEFPLLRELKIRGCKAVENFVGGDSSYESQESLFNKMVTFSNLKTLHIRGMNNIKYIWDEQFVAEDSFVKLKSINIEHCSMLSVVFPSNICTRFQRLETLSLNSCDRVEEIYQRNDSKDIKNAFSLRVLMINYLPSLKHIWNKESEWGDFFTFQNLQSVEVESCKDLKYVFPASVGCGLLQLQQLKLKGCNQLEVMIARDKDDETSAPSFQFLDLTELQLEDLKEMRGLYEGPHTFECPKLKSLNIQGCSNISIEKFIFNCEEMTIDGAIHKNTDFSAELCTKLKKVTLSSLDEETSIATVLGFLSGIKSLETLVFEQSFLEETLGLEDRQHHCLRVKHLQLLSVRNLKLIIKKDSQHLQHLQTVKLMRCYDLMSIAPSSTCFKNVTTLHLFCCNNATNLVTASTAKTMVQLKEMKVADCDRIEEIVAKDADDTEHDDEIIFNQMQFLELTTLPNFNSFCSNKCTFSFPLLEKVTIRYCSRMKNFCGGNTNTPKLREILFEGEQQWEGDLNATISSRLREWVGEHLEEGRLYPNLESLQLVDNIFSTKAISANQMQFLNRLRNITVRGCDSIQVVFDLEGDVGLRLPKLNELELINLPMLTQLCNKAPKGILDFSKLEVLKIENCSRLVYAFTWSMASCLSQLQRVEVENCEMMETLIADEEEVTAKAIFSSLENVALKNMPKLSSIYSGRCDFKCPSLYKITIMECPVIKPLFSTHQVFSQLREVSVDITSIRGMMQFEAATNLFLNLKILEVSHCSATTTSHASLVRFLSRLPSLDQLKICGSSFKELLNSNAEEAPTLPPIKSLKLINLDDLNKTGWHASLFKSLETLEVSMCGKLVNLASSSALFQNLISVEVDGCHKLMNLITPSVARNMAQLKVLKVSFCNMLMEIVGDGCDQTADEIVFINLKTLELIGLQSLKAFSLTNYDFKFPCLDKVDLQQCPNLRIFCHGTINTPTLNFIKDFGNSYWEGDLESTTRHLYQNMVGFEYPQVIKLSAFPVLKEKWEAQFPISFLSCLQWLEVDNCELFSKAIPSHLLEHLESLKVLIVEKCDSLVQVIDLEVLNANECGINRMRNLEELQLIDLPRLKQVWLKDPYQILSFKYLQFLKVQNCGNLTFIFDLSMALSLQNLQHVEVKNCSLVEHIIIIKEEETMQKYQTIFPLLQSMTLLHLTNLLSFCSTNGILECLSLKKIEVVDCPKVDLFASIEDPDSVAVLLGNEIVTYGLEELTVEWKTLKDEIIGNYQSGLFSSLKYIELTGFLDEEYAILTPTFLRHFPELEMLVLSDSSTEEIILDDLSILNEKDPESAAPLTRLKLSKLPKLKHIVCHDSQLVPLFQNLDDIEVVECGSLKILVPPSVAFHNLTDLKASKCDGLINLLSASTARSLVQLRRMSVKDCKIMQEIVAIASNGEEYDIRFSQLEYLEFDGLPSITCFSSGNYSFAFPSLQKVMITGCPNMNNFAERVSVNPKLTKIKTGRHDYDWEWEGSLNDTIQALYVEKDVEEKASQNTSEEQIAK